MLNIFWVWFITARNEKTEHSRGVIGYCKWLFDTHIIKRICKVTEKSQENKCSLFKKKKLLNKVCWRGKKIK